MTAAATKPRPLAIELPPAERGLSPSQLARYEKAKRALANPLTKPKARTEHLNTIARLESATKEAIDKAWREDAQAESVALAQGRGEDVEVTKRSGAVRIRSRDGLHNLYVNGSLTQEEYDQAAAWRDCFEARSGDVGSQMGGEGGGAGHDNNTFVANRLYRAKLTNDLAVAQMRVSLTCRDEPACFQLFNAIIGDAKCLSAFGKGSAYDRHLKAFKRALVAAEKSRRAS